MFEYSSTDIQCPVSGVPDLDSNLFQSHRSVGPNSLTMTRKRNFITEVFHCSADCRDRLFQKEMKCPVSKQHEGYFGTNFVILNRDQMTRKTPKLALPLQPSTPNQAGGSLTTRYDLTCNRPHTRWIFRGIGFRTSNPPAPKPTPYH
ncbi:hypothetical protein AVEN_201751-1 [Araneus ventricosus]|uniref:Uncharacterized protein n=1 Tax=Araneus ventricosus TaxID=182803 RepID=A0A4Y2JUX2_ARAVE|nr:hypothetical protein AVEN_171395-1 [Araneus ventricosus]GBM93857.1 hypothetical protein AVEN_201751-1 [Araneus ventricosus]